MNDICQLQEPPSTSLTDVPRSRYEKTKAYIARWEPRPCPPRPQR